MAGAWLPTVKRGRDMTYFHGFMVFMFLLLFALSSQPANSIKVDQSSINGALRIKIYVALEDDSLTAVDSCCAQGIPSSIHFLAGEFSMA